MASDYPQTYAEWRHCITIDCGIALTDSYITARIAALRDDSDPHTARFVELYGEHYHAQVVGWFERASAELG